MHTLGFLFFEAFIVKDKMHIKSFGSNTYPYIQSPATVTNECKQCHFKAQNGNKSPTRVFDLVWKMWVITWIWCEWMHSNHNIVWFCLNLCVSFSAIYLHIIIFTCECDRRRTECSNTVHPTVVCLEEQEVKIKISKHASFWWTAPNAFVCGGCWERKSIQTNILIIKAETGQTASNLKPILLSWKLSNAKQRTDERDKRCMCVCVCVCSAYSMGCVCCVITDCHPATDHDNNNRRQCRRRWHTSIDRILSLSSPSIQYKNT